MRRKNLFVPIQFGVFATRVRAQYPSAKGDPRSGPGEQPVATPGSTPTPLVSMGRKELESLLEWIQNAWCRENESQK
jgi:hypothetical protein